MSTNIVAGCRRNVDIKSKGNLIIKNQLKQFSFYREFWPRGSYLFSWLIVCTGVCKPWSALSVLAKTVYSGQSLGLKLWICWYKYSWGDHLLARSYCAITDIYILIYYIRRCANPYYFMLTMWHVIVEVAFNDFMWFSGYEWGTKNFLLKLYMYQSVSFD